TGRPSRLRHGFTHYRVTDRFHWSGAQREIVFLRSRPIRHFSMVCETVSNLERCKVDSQLLFVFICRRLFTRKTVLVEVPFAWRSDPSRRGRLAASCRGRGRQLHVGNWIRSCGVTSVVSIFRAVSCRHDNLVPLAVPAGESS